MFWHQHAVCDSVWAVLSEAKRNEGISVGLRRRSRCRWIGHRRTVGVRAETAVTAVVLSHEDMRWAVAADYRMSSELSAALRARRLMVAKAIRAEKKARKDPEAAKG